VTKPSLDETANHAVTALAITTMNGPVAKYHGHRSLYQGIAELIELMALGK
jgi:hypothetical protein